VNVGDLVTETDGRLPARRGLDGNLKHGLWCLFNRAKLDRRTKLAKWAEHLREQLVKDLGSDLSTQQEILLDRVCAKVLKSYLYEQGVLSGETFGSKDHYLALTNSLRLDLQALGLQRKTNKILDLNDYLLAKGNQKKEGNQNEK
jgi:hypothetical protein